MIRNLLVKSAYLLIIFTGMSFLSPVHAQDSNPGRRIVIEGKEYFIHVVEQGQGFYTIARQYNVSQQEIVDANPRIGDGLKSGQVIRIPVIKGRNTSRNEIEKSGDYILHTVEKGQTAWYISRKYDVSLEDIYDHNPGTKQQLIVGSIIKVPVTKSESPEIETDNGTFRSHKVQPGDSLYSLSRRFNVTVDDIVDNNPALKTGVLTVGSIIRIPVSKEKMAQAMASDSSQPSSIQGEQYIYHEIEAGQTLYSISRQYQVDVKEVQNVNPDIDPNELPQGYMLRIPRSKKKENVNQQKADKTDLFDIHRVRRKETLFSISRRYNVDMETIRKVNPDVDFSNLRRGSELKIPNDQWFVQQYPGRSTQGDKEEPSEIRDSRRISTHEMSDSLCINYEGIGHNRPMKVALMLPFALNETEEANIIQKVENGDTIKTVRSDRIIARQSTVFTEFYEGVLLALDDLKKQNVHVDLSVYDISPDSEALEQVLKINPELKDMDMIIGPARSNDLSVVSDFAVKNQIKVIYPLSNVNPELADNPYIFQINTPDTLVFDRMTNEIVNQAEGYNLLSIIPAGEDEYAAMFFEELRKKVFFNQFALNKDINYREYRISGKEDQTNLEALLDPLKKNIVVVPTNEEVTISKIVPTLAGISKKRKINISLFGMTEWLRAQSIEPEDMFTLNAQLFTFFAFDYESSETERFIEKYRRWYHTEPHAVSSYFQNSSSSSGYSRYGAWGYDVAYYFMLSMKQRGANFEYCPEPLDLHPVQFNFSFKRVSNWGGFYNQGLFLLKFGPGYEVKRVPVISLNPMVPVHQDNSSDIF